MIIANMATFPARSEVLPDILRRILPQVDKINLCLNSYERIPDFLKQPKINPFIPDQDYRDVGKFVLDSFAADDDIFYMDDDIIYPDDYITMLMKVYNRYSALKPIVGVHGLIYPDAYDGTVGSRVVFAFKKGLSSPRVVNQLGTGTIHCKGYQTSSLSYMAGSERYVDVRFACHALVNNWPLICVARQADWMDEISHDDTIFSTFTSKWPDKVVKECQVISGYSKMSTESILLVDEVVV